MHKAFIKESLMS